MEIDSYISLGSNQGDRELNLLRAVAEIGRIPQSRVTGLSRFYETSPVGGAVGQAVFYNAVLRLATSLTAAGLLERLATIETSLFGRVRSGQCDPRRMDLDLLFHGEQIIDQPGLIVPHPRLAERRFVLQPLNELAPGLRHPLLGKTVSELLASLRGEQTVIPL